MSENDSGRSDRPRRRPEDGRPERSGDRNDRSSRSERQSRGSREFGNRREVERSSDRDRPGRAGDGRDRAERPDWQTRVERAPRDDRPKSPMIPEEITEQDLDLLVRVQFKTLSPENAERVARHLAMVNLLIDQDPELAHKHALAAAERAGRIAVVRETVGVTAYTVGDFALAIRELQTFRRLSGSNDQLPLMVDSERGLGRPDRALELGRSVNRLELSPGVRANLAIAMSGARLDRGENDLALAELEIEELNPSKVLDYSPQLFRAYAHTLEILERTQDAQRWHDLADRAEEALAKKAAPVAEVFPVIEEITIPEPYESRASRDGDDRPRDRAERPRSRDDRGRDGERREPRSERGFDRKRDTSGGPERRGGRSDRPARPARPATSRDAAPRDEQTGKSNPWKRPKRDDEI